MEFRILGALEVVDGDRPLPIAGRRQQALLALLLLHANEVVASDRVIEELWNEPPRSGAAAVQTQISRLRRALGPAGGELLVTRPPGYVLHVAPDALDAARFERLLEQGREALRSGESAAAARTLSDALELWRGPALADFVYEPFAQRAIARLEDLRVACVAARVEAELALGRHVELVGELEALVDAYPLDERLRGQLMVALYRSGRQADALEAYRQTRRVFSDELGIEPSPALRRLEAAILRQDADLEPPPAPTSSGWETDEELRDAQPQPERGRGASAGRARRTVTVLVTGVGDPTGSRGLDPEVRRRLGDTAFARVCPVLERHGALVQRLIDGRVMGLFGVHVAHEDDALRALRAAVELREALTAERDTIRTGIDTGAVLAGEPASEDPVATGAALDAAALFQQSSEPGGIVIGEATRRLVRDAVRVDPLGLSDPDEQAEPLRAWNLLELIPGAPPFRRHFEAPLVGRDAELAQLRQAFERARRERRAHIVTVFGEAGIGKSRLVQELIASVEAEATVLTGRCLSYGEGITYWPLREIVDQAGGPASLRGLLEGSPDADVVAIRLESAIGVGTGGAVNEEVFWAVRKLGEALAREQPLVLVFEDIHWGEPTLLDLVEHLGDWVRDVSLLLVCLARPELLDGRPGWGGGKLNSTSILLEPLSREESSRLIGVLPAGAELAPDLRARIADAADGNPLFVEQMLAMLAQDDGGTDEVVPPAIQALLAARLDRLEPGERRLLERGAVEGETFHVGGVVALSRPQTPAEVSSVLMSLVRKELIRAEPTSLPGEEVFRFRHALICDAAYEGLAKEARSELHEHHAAWLESLGDRVPEAEELLGYHLEQAFGYRAQLGAVDVPALELAERARVRLASAGRLAFRRGDMRAAVNLLERARSLPSADERARLELAPDLGFALWYIGEFERAESFLGDAVDHARALGERSTERHASLVHDFVRLFVEPDRVDLAEMLREAEQSLVILQEAQDDLALTRAWIVLWFVNQGTGNAAPLRETAEQALVHARRAGSRTDEGWSFTLLGYALADGPTPVGEGVRIFEGLLRELKGDRLGEALVSAYLAPLVAMQGRIEDARGLSARGQVGSQELGARGLPSLTDLMRGRVETLAGDLEAAERAARAAAEPSPEIADMGFYVLAAIDLGRALCDQGRPLECLRVLDESERYPTWPDWEVMVNRPAVRALALARLGRLEEAETFAREAVGHADGRHYLGFHADALVVLAEVFRLTGRPAKAGAALKEAVALYERKGNVVSAAKARAFLEELR